MMRLILVGFLLTAAVMTSAQENKQCPLIFVRSDSVNAPPGKTTVFEAFVVGRTLNALTYEWSVSGGQFTSKNKEFADVRPYRRSGKVSVSVRVSGVPDGCADTAEASRYVGRHRGIVDYGASVYILELDKSSIERSLGESNIHIRTWSVPSTPLDVITYHYEVTGGKVIGTDKEVVWDLSGVEAGEYSMTAWVDDGCGPCGQTKTVKVAVR